jgi:hypothetical protein
MVTDILGGFSASVVRTEECNYRLCVSENGLTMPLQNIGGYVLVDMA